jgi:preprotein translocase subunit SecG
MQSVLIVIHLMIVVALVVTVLLQRSEGGALGIGGGGGGGFMSGRGQANVLTRATAILAALFFATSLGLTILAKLNQAPSSILQRIEPAKPAGTPAPAQGGNLLDQLKKMEDQRQSAPPPSK